jgi:hypothetical protein
MFIKIFKEICNKIISFLKNLFFRIYKIIFTFFLESILFFVFLKKFFRKNKIDSKPSFLSNNLEEIKVFNEKIFQKIFLEKKFRNHSKNNDEMQKKFDFDKLFFIEKCFKQKNQEIFLEFIENFNEYIKIDDKKAANDLKNIIFFDLNQINQDICQKLIYFENRDEESEFFQILELEILIQSNFIILGILYLLLEEIFEFIPKTFIEIENFMNIELNESRFVFNKSELVF